MRKIVTILTATSLALSGLALSPAHATPVELDCNDGTTTISGPSYTLDGGTLNSGGDCVGSVIIADSAVTIVDSAFQDANITNIQISNTVTTISDSAFAGTSLTSVSIPDSVTFIDGAAFANTQKLASFIVGSGNPNYSSDAGVLFNKSKSTLVSYPAAKGSTYIIPNSVSIVGAYSFINTGPENALRSVVIPASVTAIQGFAFGSSEPTEFYFLGSSNPVADPSAFGFSTTGTAYITSIAAATTGSFTLTAGKWQDLSVQTGSLVTYEGNGATTGSTPDNGQPLRKSGVPVTVSSNSGNLTKTGHTFAGWNTAANGLGSSYLATGSDLLTPSGNVTLFAKWAINNYTVTFNSNSGSAVTAGTFIHDGSVTAPTNPTRSGYTLTGWSATDGGSTVSFPYNPGVNTNITLFAKWSRNLSKATASVKPAITGKATSTSTGNNKLTAKKGTWSGYPSPKITYQWYVCTTQVKTARQTVPKTCKAIAKQTRSTFAVTSKYKGKYLAVRVTGKGTGTASTTWLSKGSAKVK